MYRIEATNKQGALDAATLPTKGAVTGWLREFYDPENFEIQVVTEMGVVVGIKRYGRKTIEWL